MSGAQQRRTWPWWYAVTSLVVGLLLAAVAWWGLPHWAPELVIRWSPWPDPVIRAAELSGSHTLLGARIDKWGPKATPALVRLLRRTDPGCALHALELLPRTRDRAALPALEAYSISHEEDRQECLNAIASLATTLHDEAAVAWVVREGPWDDEKFSTLDAMFDVFDELPGSVTALALEQLHSESVQARIRATCALRGADPAAVSTSLIAALDDPVPTVRRAVADVLCYKKTPDDSDALARHLGDDDERVRAAIARALAERLDRRAIEPLFAFAESSDRKLATLALGGLLRMSPLLDADQRARVADLKAVLAAASPAAW